MNVNGRRLKPQSRLVERDIWRLYLPVVIALFSYVWWREFPVIAGFGLAMAGLAGTVLLCRAEASDLGEKVAWGGLLVLLCLLEVREAYIGHAGSGRFLLAHLQGDRAIVRSPTSGQIRSASMHMVNQDDLNAFLTQHVEDGRQYDKLFDHIPIGSFSQGEEKSFCVHPLRAHGGAARYTLVFSALNGEWRQYLQAVTVQGKQVQAVRVLRTRGSRAEVLYDEADASFPRDPAGQVNWSWIPDEP